MQNGDVKLGEVLAKLDEKNLYALRLTLIKQERAVALKVQDGEDRGALSALRTLLKAVEKHHSRALSGE